MHSKEYAPLQNCTPIQISQATQNIHRSPYPHFQNQVISISDIHNMTQSEEEALLNQNLSAGK